AVSRTTLGTRQAQVLGGTRVVVEHGRVLEVRDSGAPVGTRVEVADLFGNTPARRKFLKAPATEVGHVSELITRTALAWPQVAFVLRHGGRLLLELAAVEDDGEPARQAFGAARAPEFGGAARARGDALLGRRGGGGGLGRGLARPVPPAPAPRPGHRRLHPPLRARQAGDPRAAGRLQHPPHARALPRRGTLSR